MSEDQDIPNILSASSSICRSASSNPDNYSPPEISNTKTLDESFLLIQEFDYTIPLKKEQIRQIESFLSELQSHRDFPLAGGATNVPGSVDLKMPFAEIETAGSESGGESSYQSCVEGVFNDAESSGEEKTAVNEKLRPEASRRGSAYDKENQRRQLRRETLGALDRARRGHNSSPEADPDFESSPNTSGRRSDLEVELELDLDDGELWRLVDNEDMDIADEKPEGKEKEIADVVRRMVRNANKGVKIGVARHQEEEENEADENNDEEDEEKGWREEMQEILIAAAANGLVLLAVWGLVVRYGSGEL